MKILNISLHFSEYSLDISRAQSASHYVTLVLSDQNAKSELTLGASFYQSDRLSIVCAEVGPLRNFFAMISTAYQLVRVARTLKPDVIHIQETGYEGVIPLLFWLWIKRQEYFLTTHDPLPHSGTDSKIPFRKRVVRSILRSRSNGIAVHGDHLLGQLASMPGFAGRKIVSIHHPAMRIQERFRADWSPGTVLFLGRLEAYKGLGVFCEAMEVLISRGVNVRPVIAGRGPELAKYRQRLESMSNAVLIERFLSPQELDCLFREAQIVALPYLDGTQSGIGAMALGHGRPVVVTNVGSLSEMLPHDQVGIVVAPNDAQAVANAIEVILKDSRRAESFGLNAHLRAGNEYSPYKTAKQLNCFYEKKLRTNS